MFLREESCQVPAVRWGGERWRGQNPTQVRGLPHPERGPRAGTGRGGVQQRSRRDAVGVSWAGRRVFGKMDGSRCPRRDAAQCRSLAASPGSRCRARPPPGPTQARGRRCREPVLLLQRDVAAGGPGPRAVGVGRGGPAVGVTPPARVGGCARTEGRPAAPMQAGGRPASSPRYLSGREGLRCAGRGVRRQWCSRYRESQGGSVHHPQPVTTARPPPISSFVKKVD